MNGGFCGLNEAISLVVGLFGFDGLIALTHFDDGFGFDGDDEFWL